MEKIIKCWCSNTHLNDFSPEYKYCAQCQTLVSAVGLAPEKINVQNDDVDFYGKNYWLGHQSEDLGYPDIFKRSRKDLTERCLHWVRTFLKYKLPPAKSLELGCAHGGFVGLLRQCGYDAEGLEMSPWIAEFARETFRIPMLSGPIENQDIANESLDIITLMDVLEHLPDPVKTMKHCLDLLKPDGVMILQTPRYDVNKSFQDMHQNQDAFLEQLKSDEHLFLFSETSVQQFLQQLSDTPLDIRFEPAIFSQYDMFVVIGKQPLVTNEYEQIAKYMNSCPNARMVQAMLDLADERDQYVKLYQQADADRVARLKIIDKLTSSKLALLKRLLQFG